MRPVEEFELFDQCAYTIGVTQYATWGGTPGPVRQRLESTLTNGGPQSAAKRRKSWSSQTGSSYG
jgi:hypothetical protein